MNKLVERWNYRRYRRLNDEMSNYRRYRHFNDDAWRRTLLDSVQGRSKVPMPSFPSAEIQSTFVGQSHEDAINAAWLFYKLMSERWKQYGLRIGRQSYVLDFGCGWGRLARMFLRDVPASHIYCADAWDLALDVCRNTGVPGQMIRLEAMPPSHLPTAQFDLAFAYSVFSHLSPKAHLAWRTELARVMKPNGLLFITTHARWFLDFCRHLREHPDEIADPWQEQLARSFVDYDASVSEYDDGEFLYSADFLSSAKNSPPVKNSPQAFDADMYGEAVVPRRYFESQWGRAEGLELLEFVADRSVNDQAIAIMRKAT
jgi:SAM-dependent methyltransferase